MGAPGPAFGTWETTNLNASLSSDKKHSPAEHNRRADKEHKAINSIADHAARRLALGDAEDRRVEESKEQHRRKVGHDFLPVRRLCASTAAITLSSPATTMKRAPQSATVVCTCSAPQPTTRPATYSSPLPRSPAMQRMSRM